MLRKVMMFGLLSLLLPVFTVPALAGFTGPGAHQYKVITVKEAATLADDAKVVLEGNILRELRHEHYLFKDASGEIEVEIDDEDLQGIEVTPQSRLRIIGEVDRDHNRPATIEADRVELLK